jgi:hypothetical protein
MPRRHLVSHRLIAVFLLGCLLFNYPLLAVLDKFVSFGSLPAGFVWLMGTWLVLIALMALIVERSGGQDF